MDEIMESEKELQEPAETPRRDARVGVLALLIGILAVGAGTWYYLQARAYEETDNAFIDGNVIQVSPRVSGRVLRVSVDDNQHVNRGDLIAEIDPSDFETSLAQAQARLKVMEAQESGAQSGVDLTSTVTGAVLVQADAGLQVAREQVQVLRQTGAGRVGGSGGRSGVTAGQIQADGRRGRISPRQRRCCPLPRAP